MNRIIKNLLIKSVKNMAHEYTEIIKGYFAAILLGIFGFFFVSIMLIMGLIFGSLGLAMYLNSFFDSTYLGFVMVSGLYVIIAILGQIIISSIVRKRIRQS